MRPKLSKKIKISKDSVGPVIITPFYHLSVNEDGEKILQLCIGEYSLDEILQKVRVESDSPAERKQSDEKVKEFLKFMLELGVIEDCDKK